MAKRNHTINRLFGTVADSQKPAHAANGNGFIVYGHAVNGKLFPSHKKKERIKILEKRLDDLENQNNRLVNFIQDLHKDFPQVVSLSQVIQHPGLAKNIPASKPPPAKDNLKKAQMTKRELEIMRLLVKGLCAKEIAAALFISESTVITHKKNLKIKFDARNSVELISKVYRDI